MNLENLHNKKIAFLGLGLENQALLKFLLKHKVAAFFTVCDKREKATELRGLPKGKDIKLKLGVDFNRNLDEFDILFRSPGWPIKCPGIQDAIRAKKRRAVRDRAGLLRLNHQSLNERSRGVGYVELKKQATFKVEEFLQSPMNLFMDLCPTKNTIGVTGTKGKGTISTLIAAILKKAKKKAWLGGNIGVAPFEFIDKIKKSDWVVLELSSFQLEDMTKSPRIAVLTNFTPEHLAPADPNNPNYHRSLKSYWNAKANIFKWQQFDDYLVVNNKLHKPNNKYYGNLIMFTKSELISGIIGEHNKENVAAAVEVAKILKIKKEIVVAAVKSYKGLEHRIERVIERNGVTYYDDSFATIPDSSIIALRCFAQPVVLLAGGADKGANFKLFAKEIKKRVKYLILFKGLGSERISTELKKIKYTSDKYTVVDSMDDAIRIADQESVIGDIVLLSPACASFGIFKNYKERGDLFKKLILADGRKK